MNRLVNKLALMFCLSLLLTLLNPVAFATAQELKGGNNSLGQFRLFTLAGDVTVAGVGLRGVGYGDIVLSEIPTGAVVHQAFLYWATLGYANTYTQPNLNGQPAPGQLIGTTGDTFWGVQNNFVYRADVTSLVSGNDTYTISNLPSDLIAGNDSQGASLVVLYRQTGNPLRTIIINDGAVALNFTRTTYTDTISGYTADSPVSDAHVTYLVGDGQVEWDSGSISFNGTPIASGVFSGADGDFWGSHTFDVTDLVSGSSATTTLSNQYPTNLDADCLLWAATIFSVTTAAPQTINQLSESFHHTLFGDVTAAGVGLRGSGQGAINLSGVPDNATIFRAYLYWATLGSSSQYTNPQLNGTNVNGELIGTSADTCWGAQANYAYRANVTSIVPGNGDYTISGLPARLDDGNDLQGASLVVIYNAAGLYRTVIINDGAVTLDLVNTTYQDDLGSFTADQPGAQSHITYLIGDGQSQWDSGTVLFEGSSIASNVFNGVDGDYWGTLRFDVSGLISEPNATTTITNDNIDCLLWAATILSVETEPPVMDQIVYLPLIER